MIYLDYSANTPVDPAVLDIYCKTELAYIANPNSTHCAGQAARAEMARVTESIASQLGVQPAEISWNTPRWGRRSTFCSSRGTRSTC